MDWQSFRPSENVLLRKSRPVDELYRSSLQDTAQRFQERAMQQRMRDALLAMNPEGAVPSGSYGAADGYETQYDGSDAEAAANIFEYLRRTKGFDPFSTDESAYRPYSFDANSSSSDTNQEELWSRMKGARMVDDIGDILDGRVSDNDQNKLLRLTR